MHMLCKILIPLLIACFATTLQGQFFDTGLAIGLSAYQGDLSPTTSIASISPANPAAGLFGRVGLVDGITARLQVSRLRIEGDDAQADDYFRRQRNLSFRSDINEVSLVVEFFPLSALESGIFRILQPYLYAGGAFYMHNPQAFQNGSWHDLHPLRTEGQGTSWPLQPEPYSLTGFSAPLGGGILIFAGNNLNIGLDIGLRATTTDYLDDVSTVYADPDILRDEVGTLSAALANRTAELTNPEVNWGGGVQRGDPQDKDWYLFASVTFAATIHDGGRTGRWWGERRRRGSGRW
jgi:hypothetical protein